VINVLFVHKFILIVLFWHYPWLANIKLLLHKQLIVDNTLLVHDVVMIDPLTQPLEEVNWDPHIHVELLYALFVHWVVKILPFIHAPPFANNIEFVPHKHVLDAYELFVHESIYDDD